MILIPYESFTISTTLSIAETRDRIAAAIEPKKAFRNRFFSNSATRPYEGTFDGHRFEINRIIGYRNSFLPTIRGTITADLNCTSIPVKMQLHPIILVFICLWLSITGSLTLIVIPQLFSTARESFTYTPLIMFVFGYLMTILGFKFESYTSRRFLVELFAGEIVKSKP